jgi:hypothetical protein
VKALTNLFKRTQKKPTTTPPPPPVVAPLPADPTKRGSLFFVLTAGEVKTIDTFTNLLDAERHAEARAKQLLVPILIVKVLLVAQRTDGGVSCTRY